MYNIGLKLWSINKQYIDEALHLYDEGVYQYIELFAVPDTFDNVIDAWKNFKCPFVIHAPHFSQGLNFAKKECFEKNKKLAVDALKFADELNANIVIFHPGVDGDIKETTRQMKNIYDSRMVIENKPYYSCDGKLICNGYAPDDIAFVLQEVGVGFCMDIAHAIYAANSRKGDLWKDINAFMTLDPCLFHLSDGLKGGVYDAHYHFGDGDFDLKRVINKIPLSAMVTIETCKNFDDSLRDFEKDVLFLKSLR